MQEYSICNNMKTYSNYMELKTKKLKCNTNVILRKKSFLTPIMSFSSHHKNKTQCTNDH